MAKWIKLDNGQNWLTGCSAQSLWGNIHLKKYSTPPIKIKEYKTDANATGNKTILIA